MSASPPRRIGIDARAAAEVPAGRGRVVRSVLQALARLDADHQYILYCREPADLDLDQRFSWQRIPLPDPIWHIATAGAASRRCDSFWSTNSYLTAWFTSVPTVVTVHDLVPFVPGAGAQSRATWIERSTIRLALRRAHTLWCVSAATENDLLRHFPAARGKTRVIPLAADPVFGRPRNDIEHVRHRLAMQDPFVLAVGTLEPRKNLLRLIEAWRGLEPRPELAVVGPVGWDADEVLAAARREGVRLLGRVPDEDLDVLYRCCEAFCYPSLYEGFGLPVLEAMSCGAAVVTSAASSLPEVAGGAALLADPSDVGDIRNQLRRILEDRELRQRLRDLGRRRATDFSWQRTAQALVLEFELLPRRPAAATGRATHA